MNPGKAILSDVSAAGPGTRPPTQTEMYETLTYPAKSSGFILGTRLLMTAHYSTLK
jgi:hypothetical protein